MTKHNPYRKSFDEYCEPLGAVLFPDIRLESIKNYVKSQYTRKPDRMYHNMKYLQRVLYALECILVEIRTNVMNVSEEDYQDLTTAVLFHRIYMSQRSVDNAHISGFLTKKHLDQDYYPRSQQVATLVELSDFVHFPPEDRFGFKAGILRDAIMAEWAVNDDEVFDRRMSAYRRDLGWDWKSMTKHFGNQVQTWCGTTAPFFTDTANDLFGQDFLEVAKRCRWAIKERTKIEPDVA